MTDRVVTVPDSLEIPADVKVPSARLSDSTAAGRALLDAADAAAQRTALGLGTAAITPATDFATAAQGAKADASDVDQITLTGDLALTVPAGFPAGQVYRVTLTQDGTGGHTVTYNDLPVTVDTTAGAVTTVELHPAGAGYVVRYPVADLDAQVSALAEDGGSALGASLSSTFAALGTRPAARALPPTRPTWITTFQSGHGWVDSLASGTMVDDTDTGDFILGAQSIHIVNSTAQKTGLGLDLTGKHLVVRLRVNAFTAGHTVAVYANDGSWSNFKVWDIVATADEQKKHFQAGEWVYVTLPWDGASSTTGTPNRAAIDTIRIRPVTQGDIHVQAIGYASEGAQTAGKVTFTFDDGYTSWLTLAAPTLAARGIRATGFVIPDFDGVAGYLTAAQCRTLQDTYGWDMQMHGDNDLSTLTAAQMRTEWTRGKKWFATNGLGRAEHIAYPYGQTDAETIATAAEFFTSGRTIARANPLESWPPAMPLRMRAVSGVSSAAGGTNVAAAKAMIDKAVAGKQWLILTFHVIGASAPDTMWCTTSDLAEIADYAAASGAEVPTIADAFA